MNQSIHRFIFTIIGMIGNIAVLLICINHYDTYVLEDFSKGFLIFQYFFLINEWGFNLYALDNIKPKNKKINKQVINEIIYSKILIGIVNSLFLSVLFTLNIISFNDPNMLFFLIIIIFFSVLNPLWFFQAIGRIELLNLPLAILKLSQVLILFTFVDSLGVGQFFILQGLLFIGLFLFNIYILINVYKFNLRVNFANFYLGVTAINKMKTHFLSNVHNHINLTLWGIVIILSGAPMQIIIFNLVDTFYRGINSIFQSMIEPIFREIKFNLKNSINLIFISLVILIPIYYFIPFLTQFFFPRFNNELTDIFKLLSLLLTVLFLSKVFTYFFLGKRNIVVMNMFNIKFLIGEIFLVISWLLFMKINTREIILLLLFLNILKLLFLLRSKLIYEATNKS